MTAGGRARDTALTAARRLPEPLKAAIRRGVRAAPKPVRVPLDRLAGRTPPGAVRWGDLRRFEPFSRDWGYSRGTPIDRVYIERFVADHAADVKGACLELLNRDYTLEYGGPKVAHSDVLDLDATNPLVTVVADLGEEGSLPVGRYDCFVFTQTIHLIPDMTVALANAWAAVKPGGVLLVTVPALGRHVHTPGFEHDRWRVTPAGLDWLLRRLPGAAIETAAFGNLFASVAFLAGMGAEEIEDHELWHLDPEYPVIVGARVLKQG